MWHHLVWFVCGFVVIGSPKKIFLVCSTYVRLVHFFLLNLPSFWLILIWDWIFHIHCTPCPLPMATLSDRSKWNDMPGRVQEEWFWSLILKVNIFISQISTLLFHFPISDGSKKSLLFSYYFCVRAYLLLFCYFVFVVVTFFSSLLVVTLEVIIFDAKILLCFLLSFY